MSRWLQDSKESSALASGEEKVASRDSAAVEASKEQVVFNRSVEEDAVVRSRFGDRALLGCAPVE